MLGIIVGAISVTTLIIQAPKLKASMLNSPLTTTIYDNNGKPVSKLFHEENRIKIDIKNVPKTMKEAVTSIEDRRFYKHSGIDIHRMAGAAIHDIKKGKLAEGGSTITQQVVKRSILSPKKTFGRKIQEAWLALQLERKYSKDQILDMYLNKNYYGERAYGLATASETYFGTKDISKLNVSQMALLAGLPNAPSANNPYTHPKKAADRRDHVLDAMVDTDAITKTQAKKAESIPMKDLVVKKKKPKKNDDTYEAFVDTVYRQLVKDKKVVSEKQFFQGGLKIHTTLDKNVQKKVYELIHSDEIDYPDKYFEAGISVIDTQSGAVRAVGGGRHFKAITYTNYGSQVKNQTGSTMKPVIDYGPAIEHLKWSTAHPITDEPFHYKGSKHKEIHNWDGGYKGSMTLRNALAYSRNIPALKTMYAVGKDQAVEFAENLGLDFKKPVYDPVAIGSYDPGATPLQMAGAYAAFGNKGVYHEPYTVTKINFPDGKTIKPDHPSHTAMHDSTAYMITDILKSVIEYGTGNSIQLPGLPVAGKTGSVGLSEKFRKKHDIYDTSGYSDEWFTGFTTQYTAAIWTGYPSLTAGGKVHYMSSDASKNIAKVFFERLMAGISADQVADFQRPDSVAALANGEFSAKGEAVSGSTEHNEQSKTEQPEKQSPDESKTKQDKEDQDEKDANESDESQHQKDQSKDKDKEKENKKDQNNGHNKDKGSDDSKDNGHQDHPGKGNGNGNDNDNGSGNGNGSGDDNDKGNGNDGNDDGGGQGGGNPGGDDQGDSGGSGNNNGGDNGKGNGDDDNGQGGN